MTVIPQAQYFEEPSPGAYARAVASMLERCPQLAALSAHTILPSPACDEDEDIEVVAMTGEEALAAIESGDIRDAKSIIGILRWARRGAG